MKSVKMNTSSVSNTFSDDLASLLAILPPSLRRAVEARHDETLVEVVLDLGRPVQARYPSHAITLDERPLEAAELDAIIDRVGEFGADNRAGIEGTLHRISAIRNRRGRIIGLTLRVGRAVLGTIDPLRDLLEDGRSLLLLGRPGVGKTTMLREIARVLADEHGKRVIVIDTSNEIAGDGDIPHPAIGGARRMQVPHPERQHAVMIEAVENHMPEVIVIDEIGTPAEALAARTIAERGVQLIGTAHGGRLENLVANPSLNELVGGVQTVTLGDDEARHRGSQKTVSERKADPCFHTVVEIRDRDRLWVYPQTAAAVDRILRGRSPGGEPRGGAWRQEDLVETVAPSPRPSGAIEVPPSREGRTLGLYPYCLSRDAVERVIRDLRAEARVVRRPEDADLILALKSREHDPRLHAQLEDSGAAFVRVRKNTTAQIRRALQDHLRLLQGDDEDAAAEALRAVEAAVERVLAEGVPVALEPVPASLRRLQHRLVNRHRLFAESQGRGPERHLVIHPPS